MRQAVVGALVMLAALAAPAASQQVHYEGGVSVSSGQYLFTERTTTWALTNGFAVSSGPFTFRASVPLYYQNTTLLAGGALPVPTGGSSGGAVADSVRARRPGGQGQGGMMARKGTVEVPSSAVTGFTLALGDPVAGVNLRAISGPRLSLSLGGYAKVPVADTATFGTGQWDVGVGASVSATVGRRGLVALDLTYWHLGDPPELDLSDPILASASGSVLFGSWLLGASVSGGTAVIDTFDGPLSLGLEAGRITPDGVMLLHAGIGLSETSPDFTAGVTWRFGL